MECVQELTLRHMGYGSENRIIVSKYRLMVGFVFTLVKFCGL
jgi:hypothetical protein